MNKPEEGIITPRLEELIKEVQGIMALSYILLIIIGMIYEAIYFSLFGINIFEYSVVFDFLVAPFKKIEFLGFLLMTILLSFLVYWLDVYLNKRFPRFYHFLSFGMHHKSWYKGLRIASVLILLLALVTITAFNFGRTQRQKLLHNEARPIEVLIGQESDKSLIGQKIGSNSNFIFLLDQAKKVHILPLHSSVEQIQFPLENTK